MKKLTIVTLVLVMILQLVPLTTHGIDVHTSHPVYQGWSNTAAHYQNLQFNDIRSHWAKGPIIDIAALSYMKGINSTTFAPNRNLSHIEALAVLVRAIGKEEEAQRLGEFQGIPKVRDMMIYSPIDKWAKGYIQVAIQYGILTPLEVDEVINLSPREGEALERQINSSLQSINPNNYNQNEINLIERQIRDQIETKTKWNKPASRQQVAQWLARVIDIKPVYSENIVNLPLYNDWLDMDTEKVPYIEALIQGGIMRGTSDRSFSPRGNITRAEMAQLVSNVLDSLLEKKGLQSSTGTVINIERLEQQGINKTLFTIENTDYSKVHFLVEEDKAKELLVQSQGELGLSEQLRIGSHIKYYTNKDNEILYAKIVPNQTSQIQGFIEYIDPNNYTLTLVDFNDKRHILKGDQFTGVSINQRDGQFKDLFSGQEVSLTTSGNKITKIHGVLEEDPTLQGYIPPGSRIKVGDVLFITKDEIEINTDNGREKYKITSFTTITRSGNVAKLFEVKTGDRVMLHFDDIYSPDIAQIRVEDQERHITAVYRGTLEQVNQRTKEAIINKVSIYNGTTWTDHPDQKVKLKLNDNNIYLGGKEVSIQGLDSHRGKEVYAAIEESYGVKQAAKLLVKEGSTLSYEDKIKDIRFGQGNMNINNNLMAFNEGTIVIQNNRLVDIINLDNNQTVNVVADLARGQRTAALVSIQHTSILDPRIDGSRLVIYRGKIEDIYDYGVKIGKLSYQLNYMELNNHVWREVTTAKTVTVTEDTHIMDAQLGKDIPANHFLGSRFVNLNDIKDITLRNRVKDRFYVGKTAYFVIRETTTGNQKTEEVLAINLTPNLMHYNVSVNTDNGTMGEIDIIDLDNGEITLRNMRILNPLNNRWETVANPDPISLSKAVIIINDKPIDQDSLYLLKKRAQVYGIKNKNVSTSEDLYILIVEQ